uniref:Uncharacterized protein TCIL3000_10_13000 n=1 Tax=Trypanosoma congolense (strain IL3000) TaxID=1068625 RepID=G0UYQ1_TRYCI|nr:unnamed protein product [Trypanosoma congolense IL3000]
MQRRLAFHTNAELARGKTANPLWSPVRRCTAKKSDATVGSRTGKATVEEPSAASASRQPQRKDWRTHKEVVYVKGVPVKGSLRKLPWKEQALVYTIFSITGSAAVYLVRPVIRYCVTNGFLGLPEDSSWVNGPWLYRFLYVLIMYPSYSLMLFIIATAFGRRVWFSFMLHKMWSRFLTKRAATRLEHLLDLQHY